MKLKAKKLTKMIMDPFTKDEQKQLDNIINDTDHAATDTFQMIEKEKVSWGAMKNHLNKKEVTEKKHQGKVGK
jgi:hypothetical protein